MRVDNRNRAPGVEVLPDLRRRVTRVYDVINDTPKSPGLWAAEAQLPWGTADITWPTCLLVKQSAEGQIEQANDAKIPARLTRVYEELSRTAETQVGQPDTTIDQDNLTEVTVHWLQFSRAAGGTPVYQSAGVNTFTAPNGVLCALKNEARTDDGDLAKIDRLYISKGRISTSTDDKYNGALTLKTEVWVNDPQDPPSGFVLVSLKIDHPDGLPVYTYVWAKGSGQISSDTEYLVSPDEGTTGVTKTTIKFLSAPDVDSNPITPPSGFTLIGLTMEEQDGYRMWTGIYAKGVGVIDTKKEIRSGGKLIIYSITSLNLAPTAPDPTIGGTVVVISQDTRNGSGDTNGSVVYDYSWAEGEGEVGRDVAFEESITQGVTQGITRTTIRFLVASGATVQPTTLSGSISTGQEYQEQDGYRIWTTHWAKGTGTVDTQIEYRFEGALVLYRLTAIGAAPSAPSPTIGGTVTLIGTDQKIENGITRYDYRWAEGKGTIDTETEKRNEGNLVLYHIVSLGVAPTAPSPTIGGTVTSIATETKLQDGYTIFDYRWAEGKGVIDSEVDTRQGGNLILYRISSLGVAPTTPSATIGGTVTSIGQDTKQQDGYVLFDYRWAEGEGQISSDVDYRLSPDEGVTGVTVTTIKFLSALTVTDNPITPPSGGVLITEDWEYQDGYKVWTGTYATGQGAISTSVEMRFDDNLQITTITAINAPPDEPDPALGGVVVLIKTDVRNGTRFEAGTVIYTYTWAEAAGGADGAEISIETDYQNSVDTGTHGITRTTLRYIVAPESTIQPTTFGSAVLVRKEYQEEEGYGIWTTVWASGTGTIQTEIEKKEFGDLILYRLVAINTAPSAPSATIGGTVVAISTDVRVENGITIYDYRWAEGKGLVLDESQISKSGVLVTYHRVSLGVAPTTPTATIGGTVTLFESEIRNQDGYQLYDYRWAEGKGQADITTRGEADGKLLYTVTDLAATTPAGPPAYPGSGTAYCTEWRVEPLEGYFRNTGVWLKPPAQQTFKKTTDFDMPGQVEETSPDPGYVLVPGNARMQILADVTVDYDESQITDTPFTVSAWVGFTESYVIASNGMTVTRQWGMGGYLSGGFTISGGAATYNNVAVSSYTLTVASSTPSAPPSGSTVIHTSNDPYLVDITGTVVYRRTKVEYSF